MRVKVVALTLALVVVVNLIAFALGWIGTALFWGVIIVVGLIAYFVLPGVAKRQQKLFK